MVWEFGAEHSSGTSIMIDEDPLRNVRIIFNSMRTNQSTWPRIWVVIFCRPFGVKALIEWILTYYQFNTRRQGAVPFMNLHLNSRMQIPAISFRRKCLNIAKKLGLRKHHTSQHDNKSMKGQSEIAYLPKFANMILIVMMIVITEILYVILIFDCFENQ